MKNIKELRKELVIMKELEIKPNYAELARKYNCDYRTVKKYNDGYEGKSKMRQRKSKLDKYKEEIYEKINKVGANKKGVYEYFKDKYSNIGSYSNFGWYIRTKKLITKNISKQIHPRYETEMGLQMQFDWKEDITMTNKYGEVFEFNIFSSILCASRFHIFRYSKTKTREDVERCLIESFEYIGSTPKEILTDNMSSIVNHNTKRFVPEFTSFCKDIGVKAKHCKVRSPETKGKVESQNRFMKWLIPYDGEFETEEDLIKIIDKINKKVNQEVNDTTGLTPIFLFEKEKEYLNPLPNKELLERYKNDTKSLKVSNGFLINYKGSQYSVPPKFINKTVKIRELNNKLYIYYNEELVTCHDFSNKKINYKEEHYKEGLSSIINEKNDIEIETIAKNNLKLLNNLTNKKEAKYE